MKKLYLILSFLLLTATAVKAQQTFPVNGTTDPKSITYAITNANIYVDYKTIIPRATLLIRDGLIVEVGENISINLVMIDSLSV